MVRHPGRSTRLDSQDMSMVGSRQRRRGQNRVTIREVAALARVSTMTVSRVINDEATVAEETRASVLAAIRELNYMPNTAARRLAGSETLRLGLLFSNPSTAYLAEFLVGALDEAAKTGHQLIVERCAGTAAPAAALQKLINGGADGLILPPPLCDIGQVLDEVRQAEVAAVSVASGNPPPDMPAVGMDNFAASLEMTRSLIALGHRRIAFIKGHPNQSVSDQRLQGYRTALGQAGLPVDDTLMEQGYFDYRSGLTAAGVLLGRSPRPTALFAANDDMAAAAISVALRMGLQVPGDISIVGFDDTLIASAVWPALTTIRQPIAEMGAAAVDLVLEEIRRRRTGDTSPAPHRRLSYALITRQSSGRAGR